MKFNQWKKLYAVTNSDGDDQTEKETNHYQFQQGCDFTHHGEGKSGLKLGLIAYSDDEAFDMYNRHAIEMGFSIQKSQIRYIFGTKEIRERKFFCYKEGLRVDSGDSGTIIGERLDTRTGCKAFVTFKVHNGVWKIVKFDDEHNHPFVPPEQRCFLRSRRKIPDEIKGVIDSMVNSGIRPTRTCNFLAKEVGGVQNIPFTASDLHNYVQSQRSNLIEPSDAQKVLNHFKDKQAQHLMFFYAVQLDQENRMTNFFWQDGKLKIDADCFGDVVTFDTTFRTNKYNLICAPFFGVNHHWKNVLLGCVFLLDESTESFVWVFEAFLEAVSEAPQTIFTDQDQDMANAIRKVFGENTCHRLCDWHIFKNAAIRISTLYNTTAFKKVFSRCFYSCRSAEEFEFTWNKMITDWNTSENK